MFEKDKAKQDKFLQVIEYDNGDIYGGEVSADGKKNGYGVLTLKSGIEIEGTFLNDRPDGQCVITDLDKNKYIGTIKNGYLNGECVIQYANKDQFVGYVVNNKKEGQGRYTFADGKFYLGEFKNDKFDGKGTLIYLEPNKEIITGIWKDGKKIN